uniref:Uncharacterized protein n=1 Tax=Tanacetum cinerariifolium TaxID=118510 RepID=A0A699I2X3_TANCI|nr:hypothetical protein [Tanacetum cinerariifolium]
MMTLKFAKTPNMVAFFEKPTESEGFEQIVDFLSAHTLRKPKRKDTKVPQLSVPTKCVTDEGVYKELDDRLVRAATTTSSLEAEQDSGNIDKTQCKETPNEASSLRTNSGGGPRCQEAMRDTLLKLVNDQDDAEMFDVNDLHGEEVFVEKEVVNKEVSVVGEVNAASIATTVSATATITTEEITLAQALMEIKTLIPKAKGIVLQYPSEYITTTTIYLKKSKDKGKAIMIEEHVKHKKKDQIRIHKEDALKLQAEFDEEQRIAREKAKK